MDQSANTQSHLVISPWAIHPDWSGDTVVCIASGPSLTVKAVDYCQGKARVIVINDNYQLAPWADMLYACDHQWWLWHYGVPDFMGLKVTQDKDAAEEFGLTWIPSKKGSGLSENPEYIHQGRNSGYQAINIAHLMGASRVLLLGYDMHTVEGQSPRWFGHHPNQLVPDYRDYIEHFNTIANQGAVEVINCTPGSAIECFEKRKLTDVL